MNMNIKNPGVGRPKACMFQHRAFRETQIA